MTKKTGGEVRICPLGPVYSTQLAADLDVAVMRRQAEAEGLEARPVAQRHVNHWHVYASGRAAKEGRKAAMRLNP